jgi:hypothetical protein
MIALCVRACASPADKKPLALPKRVARARRVTESKRMDSFRSIHESLKKTAKEEKEFVDSFFKKTQDMWNEIEAANDDEPTDDE